MTKTRIVKINVSEFQRSAAEQLKEIENRLFHMYAQTDGTYCIPNSCEGDLLKLFLEYIALTKQESLGIYYGLPLSEGAKIITIDCSKPSQFGTFNPFKVSKEKCTEAIESTKYAFCFSENNDTNDFVSFILRIKFKFSGCEINNKKYLLFHDGSPEEVKKIADECHVELKEAPIELSLEALAINNEELSDTVHDVIVELKGVVPSDEIISKVIALIPKNILFLGVQWGFKDTEFGDEVYEWLNNNDYLSQIMEELNG